jgi:hypothetical protein
MNYFPLPTEPILPSLIDYRLKTQPESTFALFSSSDDELNRITFLEFGRACQRLARIVAPAAPLKSGYPVAIVANCDTLQYITAVGGLAYAGLAVSKFGQVHSTTTYGISTGISDIVPSAGSSRLASPQECFCASFVDHVGVAWVVHHRASPDCS